MPTLDEVIELRIGEVRTEAIDISFGEIVNLHSTHEFIIQPEYQRLFRWSDEQRSRLVESILLELPIPQIFVIENEDGVFELIDGLQRISSIIQFIEPKQLGLEPLVLVGCDLIPELNGKVYEDLSLRLKLTVKRSAVRNTVIKRQSLPRLRYEMFKRLNTGGSILSAQEIRNCNARMVGEHGIKFYEFLQSLAENSDFRECIASLSPAVRDQRGDEELVLRHLALKNARDQFRGNVREWLDEYQEEIVLNPEGQRLDADREKRTFERLFSFLNSVLGEEAFVRFNKENRPVGGLSAAYYEAVTMGVLEELDNLSSVSSDAVRDAIITTTQSAAFRDATGPSANTRGKLTERINLVKLSLGALT